MNLIRKVHHQQEDETSCVPASLAMVYSAYGKVASQSELRGYMEVTPGGTQIEAIWSRIPFNRWDPECEIQFRSTLEQIQASLDTGAPVIAIILSSYLLHSEVDSLHALVVVGIDKAYLYINDPLTLGDSVIRMSRETFEEAWEWYDRCTILIKPLSN